MPEALPETLPEGAAAGAPDGAAKGDSLCETQPGRMVVASSKANIKIYLLIFRIILLHRFGFCGQQILADVFGARFAALTPVTVPVRAMWTAFAVLATGDLFQAVGS
jgi:hypothetical protein